MFDSSKPFAITILSGEERQCTCRFPTDDEWDERARKQKIIRRSLGRGKTESDVPDAEAVDAALFARIRTDNGEPFDAAEACAVIGKMERAEVVRVVRAGNQFEIDLRVFGGTVTKHVVKLPMQRDVMEHSRASMSIIGAKRSSEIRVHLAPSGELYDKVLVRSEGYAGPVPIVHKATVVSELLEQIAVDDDEDPEA